MKLLDGSSGSPLQTIQFHASLTNIVSLISGGVKVTEESQDHITHNLFLSNLNEEVQSTTKIYKFRLVSDLTENSTSKTELKTEEKTTPHTNQVDVCQGDNDISPIVQDHSKYLIFEMFPKI